MKKLILICCVAFFALLSCDDEKDIPASEVTSLVLNTFEVQFPNADDVEWEKKAENYLVEFEVGDVDYNAIINAEGELLKYKYDLRTSEIPEMIMAEIRKKYPKKVIDEAEIIKNGNTTYYQVEFEGSFSDLYKTFTETGKEEKDIEYWD